MGHSRKIWLDDPCGSLRTENIRWKLCSAQRFTKITVVLLEPAYGLGAKILADFWFWFQFKFHKYWSTSANCLKSFFQYMVRFITDWYTTSLIQLQYVLCNVMPAWFVRTPVKHEKVWRTKLPCYISVKLCKKFSLQNSRILVQDLKPAQQILSSNVTARSQVQDKLKVLYINICSLAKNW